MSELSNSDLYMLINLATRPLWLADADLSGAALQHVDLEGADLRRADLAGSNLSGASLKSAHLEGANLVRLGTAIFGPRRD